jgi:type I restriction enzyme S subunit
MSELGATSPQEFVSKYKPYPEYKDSMIEWLHSIPKHWLSTKVKYGFDITLGKMLTKEPKDSSYELKPYLKAINIQPEGVNVSAIEKMWFSPSEIKSLRLKRNDVLISEGGDVGRSAIWNEELPECYIQNAVNRARAFKKHSPRFFYYWMIFLKQSGYIEILCNKSTIAHYTAEKVEASPLLLPIEEEQYNIAAFLDYETAQIDRLIAKQQQLMELLKEKRQAVISHVVTKGLNPNASMKDSCVEWLGQVPEHWNTPKLFYVTSRIGDGLHSTPIYQEGTGYFFVNGNNLNNGDVTVGSTAKGVPFEEYQAHYINLDERSVLLSINGTIGNVALYRNEPIILGKSAAYINCKAMLSPDYLRWYLTIDQAKLYYKLEATGTTIYNLSLGSIRNMKVLLPPMQEQHIIAQFCSASYLKYEQLISAAIKKMSILQERRTALISAAVTGKIDLRGWTLPSDNEVTA